MLNPQDPKYATAFQRLLKIMNELREQCPWDKKQTLETLRHLTIEETYELSDAILEGDLEEVKKELGDLMLHIVFYSKIGHEKNSFDVADVINGVCEKLISRHPHIYGDVKVENEAEVRQNWEMLKLKEQEGKPKKKKGVLSGVPQSLPALLKAYRMQEKAAGVGFDWDEKDDVWEKVEEEMNELKAEFHGIPNEEIDMEKAEDEFGDVLFSLINYARFMKINPETALERTNKKFMRRFGFLESESEKDGKKFGEMDLAEMDAYWNEAKKKGL